MNSIKEYNLHTRNQIPKDYECCYNCKFMSWMVGIGQGVRCGNEKNRYRHFRIEGEREARRPWATRHNAEEVPWGNATAPASTKSRHL